jgi:hypothetical protein
MGSMLLDQLAALVATRHDQAAIIDRGAFSLKDVRNKAAPPTIAFAVARPQ